VDNTSISINSFLVQQFPRVSKMVLLTPMLLLPKRVQVQPMRQDYVKPIMRVVILIGICLQYGN
jgi:hypothetical protein